MIVIVWDNEKGAGEVKVIKAIGNLTSLQLREVWWKLEPLSYCFLLKD